MTQLKSAAEKELKTLPSANANANKKITRPKPLRHRPSPVKSVQTRGTEADGERSNESRKSQRESVGKYKYNAAKKLMKHSLPSLSKRNLVERSSFRYRNQLILYFKGVRRWSGTKSVCPLTKFVPRCATISLL